jgi:hypothetical protein
LLAIFVARRFSFALFFAFFGGAGLWGSCGRSGEPIIDVGDAPNHTVRCGITMTYALSPLTTSVGARIRLQAAAQGVDGGTTNAAVSWRAPRGRIDAPALDTTFTCLVGGRQAIDLTVKTSSCSDTVTFPITCVPSKCGNGQIDSGEQCDPPNGSSCLDGCALPCGNGLLDAGEQCDPPDGTTCSSTCRKLR